MTKTATIMKTAKKCKSMSRKTAMQKITAICRTNKLQKPQTAAICRNSLLQSHRAATQKSTKQLKVRIFRSSIML